MNEQEQGTRQITVDPNDDTLQSAARALAIRLVQECGEAEAIAIAQLMLRDLWVAVLLAGGNTQHNVVQIIGSLDNMKDIILSRAGVGTQSNSKH
jgi:hypothetical protein